MPLYESKEAIEVTFGKEALLSNENMNDLTAAIRVQTDRMLSRLGTLLCHLKGPSVADDCGATAKIAPDGLFPKLDRIFADLVDADKLLLEIETVVGCERKILS